MSKSIAFILSNASAVTDLLADGADSVSTLYNPQGQSLPCVVVLEDNTEDFGSYSSPSEGDKVSVTVYAIAKQQYDGASAKGAYDIVNQCRKTLEASADGTYNGEAVSFIRKEGGIVSEYVDWDGADVVTCYQRFTLWRDVDAEALSGVIAYLLSQAAFDGLSDVNANAYYLDSDTVSAGGFTTVTSNVLVSISYSNDAQTIYAESGTGSFTSMEVTPDPAGATGTYSFTSGGAGLAINSSTGAITVDNYANILSGENTTTVQLVGSGSYTGTVTVDITLTKEVLKTLEDLSGVTVKNWYRDTSIVSASNKVSQLTDETSTGNITEGTSSNQPFEITSKQNGKSAVMFTANRSLSGTMSTTESDFWIFGVFQFTPCNNSSFYLLTTSSGDIRILLNGTSTQLTLRQGGTSTSYNIPDSLMITLFEKPRIWGFHFNGASSEIWVDGVKIADLTLGTGSGNTLSGTTYVGSFSSKTLNFGGYLFDFAVIEKNTSSLSTDERQDAEGYLAAYWDIQENLDVSHPHKTLPEFV